MSQPKTRPNIAAKERGPGPGRYAVDANVVKKKSAAFSFGLKGPSSLEKKSTSPGPVYLVQSNTGRHGTSKPPAYSFGAKPKETKKLNTPAPGAYAPEKVAPTRQKKAPAYSMGGRTRQRKRDYVPGPNSYSIPGTMGEKVVGKKSSAAYTMTGRPKIGGIAQDLAKAPPPNSYQGNIEATKKKAPAYSMQSRTFTKTDTSKRPGPGAHDVEKVNLNKKKAPAFSMGGRHSEYKTELIVDVPE
eukprot:m.25202 g.25202  ORF g.25202 m.25202 type:complete len:243 (+) comp13531_c0_seq2:73-801(+)